MHASRFCRLKLKVGARISSHPQTTLSGCGKLHTSDAVRIRLQYRQLLPDLINLRASCRLYIAPFDGGFLSQSSSCYCTARSLEIIIRYCRPARKDVL